MAARVAEISAEATRPLRRAILRPGQPPAAAVYPGDDAPGSVHFGAFKAGELVGIASYSREAWEEAPAEPAARLRGMATQEDVRGAGFGLALIEAGNRWARSAGIARIWCNARSSAASFYRHAGFEAHGNEFEIEGIGPHFVMTIQIDEASSRVRQIGRV